MTQFFCSNGGAPLVFCALAKALASRGHKIFVLCNVASGEMSYQNIKIKIVKPFLTDMSEIPPSPIQNLRYLLNSLLYGSSIISKNKIDIIHTNSFSPVIAGSLLSKLHRVPVIATIHDVFSEDDTDRWKEWAFYNNLPKYYSRIGTIYEKLSLNMPLNLLHAVSNATKNDILSHKRTAKVRVIYTGVDQKSYEPSIKLDYEDFILYIGRLVFYKNVTILIKAFKEVIGVMPKAKLVIVGEGHMRPKWEMMSHSLGLDENIVFTGTLSNEAKLELLRRCSALALPSLFEGFGLVLLEAFNMAKPVLVAKTQPFDEIVNQEIDGYLLPYDDPQEWASKIIHLLSDKDLCKRMGKNALTKIREKFDFKNSVDQFENLYEETILN